MRDWKRLHWPGWYERTGWLTWRVHIGSIVPWWLGLLRPADAIDHSRETLYTVRGLNVPARLWLGVWCWMRRPWRRLDGYYRETWLVMRVRELEAELERRERIYGEIETLLGRDEVMEDSPPREGGRGR